VTAEPADHGGRPEPAPVRVDAFLLAGQFPGTSHAQALRDALSYALAAEQAGFDGVWIAEHHFISYGVCPSALAFAAHLLGRTTRIRVGTAACIMPNRHPVALAEEAVLLDEVSGGRLDLGVARGGAWIDLDVFGTGLHRYTHGFAESLDLLLAWLSGTEKVGADGELFRFPPVAVVPAPRRPVPVWVAATSESTVALAAARRLPLLLGMHATTQEKRRLLDHYHEQVPPGPPDPGAIAHASAHVAQVADTRAEAGDVLRAAMPGWLATTAQYVRIDGSTGPVRDPRAYVEHLLDIHPVGPPQLCVQRLTDAMAATGARRLLLMVEGAGDPAKTLANIARLGADVLPQLRRWPAGSPVPATAFDNGCHFR
jgi:alkanesulfonate monooxygenase SsuD/methylene tetrahydromethanopterin reductase-like flavin-dependent oxidoreductase (luciferase family)